MRSLGKGGEPAKPGAAPDPKSDTPEAKEAKAALEAAESDPKRPKEVPAKYWDAKTGAVNYGAWAKSTTELETKLRTTGLPPKTADDYKYDVPEKVKALGGDVDPKMSKAFRDLAHSKGLNQEQYAAVMDAYFEHAQVLGNQAAQFSEAACRAELLKVYKTEEELTKANQRAYRAFEAFATPEELEQIDTVGNIPLIVRMFERIGKEIGEDPGVHPDAILDGESLQQLMRGGPGAEDSPYWNQSDPRHAVTKAKVARHHEAVAAQNRRKAA